MKNIILFACLLAVLTFSSCEKENHDISTAQANTISVRYDFTASVTGEYDIQAIADSVVHFERTITSNWSKTLTIQRRKNGPDSAHFEIFPPIAWIGTGIESHIQMKISVNNLEKASKTGTLLGNDRANGIKLAVQL